MNSRELLDSVKFKDPEDEEDVETIHGLLLIVLLDMAYWHNTRGYEMTITDLVSTLEEDEELQRESDAHRTKRGADLRCKHMSKYHKEEFRAYFNKKYADIASISRSDLKPRIVVEHGDGDSRHFHVALHYRYRIVK